MQDDQARIDAAAAAFLAARVAETAAYHTRIAAEEKLIELVGLKAEGTTTATTGTYKIKTEQFMRYSLDQAAWSVIAPGLPDQIRDRIVRLKAEPAVAFCRYLAANEPEIYAKVAQALTIKPAKPTVSVEVVEARAAA